MEINEKLINLDLEAETWELALEKLAKFQNKDKYVNSKYKEKIISLTKEIGPYYIITKNIAIPHLRPEEGVLKEGFSFFRFKNTIKFDNDKEIKYFIYILSLNSDKHIKQLSYIMDLIENKELFYEIENGKMKEKEILKYIKGEN